MFKTETKTQRCAASQKVHELWGPASIAIARIGTVLANRSTQPRPVRSTKSNSSTKRAATGLMSSFLEEPAQAAIFENGHISK